jgi:D-3-phosphoglycerate dehydrogenase
MKGKILVTARSFRNVEGEHQEVLRRAGYELVFSPHDRPLQPDELTELAGDAVAIVAGLDHFTRAVFERTPQLRVVSRFGVGVDNVDLEAATEHKVVVTITPGANSVTVAELTMLLMLALSRHLVLHDRWVRSGSWKRASGVELMGGTLGIVGLGRIGREVAARARAFGMRIVFTDPVLPPEDLVRALEATALPLDDLLSTSDVITLHLPLSAETHHLIGARELALMKPSAFLINTARGGLVDEEALYAALKEGRLAGAAFDVFEKEPPGASPLLQLDNFIATPHIGSATVQTTRRMGWMAAQNALAVLEGRRPEGVVNPQVYTFLGEM